MEVIHILKGGSTTNDISGHVVRVGDAVPLYQMIDRINQNGSKTKIVRSEKSQEVKVC